MAELAALPLSFQSIFVCVVGLILGSFASALAYRAPRHIGWGLFSKTRSECPSCGRVLRAAELIPLFSWLYQRGRCRGCNAPIPPVYPLVEAGCVVLSLGVWAVYGFTLPGLVILISVPFLAALLAVDLEHMILPNSLVAALLVLGGAFHAVRLGSGAESFEMFLYNFVAAGLVYGGLFWLLGWGGQKILKREALGFGDVKFFAVCGFWLGFTALSPLCLLAGLVGIVFGLFWKLVLKSDIFPFGPALILAFYAVLLLQGAGLA